MKSIPTLEVIGTIMMRLKVIGLGFSGQPGILTGLLRII